MASETKPLPRRFYLQSWIILTSIICLVLGIIIFFAAPNSGGGPLAVPATNPPPPRNPEDRTTPPEPASTEEPIQTAEPTQKPTEAPTEEPETEPTTGPPKETPEPESSGPPEATTKWPPPNVPKIKTFEELRKFYSNKLDLACGERTAHWVPTEFPSHGDYHAGPLKVYEQPWYLEIYIINKQFKAEYLCSGVLVAADWALTSHECLLKIESVLKPYYVAMGHTRRQDAVREVERAFLNSTRLDAVKEIDPFELFSNEGVALLKLTRPFAVPLIDKYRAAGTTSYLYRINTICLPPPAAELNYLTFGDVQLYEFVGMEHQQGNRVTIGEKTDHLYQVRVAPRTVEKCEGFNPDGDLLRFCGGASTAVCRYAQVGSPLFRFADSIFGPDDTSSRAYLVGSLIEKPKGNVSIFDPACPRSLSATTEGVFILSILAQHANWIAETWKEN